MRFVNSYESWFSRMLQSMNIWAILFVLGSAVLMQAQSPAEPSTAPAPLRVCCRPLPKWSGSKNLFLFALNKIIVTHLHHCYIDLGSSVTMPGIGSSVQTTGIHPIQPDNHNKQPIPDQITDALLGGGECKNVADVTPEKVQRLKEELAGASCHSCGANYHNRVMSFCYNNSNTYVYDLISSAGMTPPKMHGAPGYRRYHACVSREKRWK